MRRVLLPTLIAASLAVLGLTAASADQPSPGAPSAPAVKPDKNDPNRIVCTREHVVGSNRPRKICMTVAERQRLKDQADRDMDISKHNLDSREDLKKGF
ncbi:hypothetical protein QO010_000222 [Caulobacter ginsengisoli]|uniref:Secreted protein n=1 Tax=Caulobacter ginsengisoli TaxID=400775 RepID=A0ABU0IKE3_9CAUL|nr:hypothetical protein [Caulobacter ginsengisoli]MDQ0462474.1 hypothetical protein [Caulobacter ginsengisoli]